ncbi:MAG: hypothetical protein IPM98_16445 [Lewinellaceae bacterium]|nr:hypothetical protein [Lewinellaceae bacterium]
MHTVGSYDPRTAEIFALLGVFTKQPRVEPLGENTKQGENFRLRRMTQKMLAIPSTPQGRAAAQAPPLAPFRVLLRCPDAQ